MERMSDERLAEIVAIGFNTDEKYQLFNLARELLHSLQAERAEVERLKQDRDDWHSVVKDICEEWNEDCDPDCNSYGHTEGCKATSIAQAKRELNERAEKAEAEVERLRELVSEVARNDL